MKGRAVCTVALKLLQSLKGLSLKAVISFQHWDKESLLKEDLDSGSLRAREEFITPRHVM